MRTTRSKSRNRPKRAARQYTIRAVPPEVDQSLRKIAHDRGISLNAVLLDALRNAAGQSAEPIIHHDLDHLIGSMKPDPDLDRALEEMRVVDPEMWQ